MGELAGRQFSGVHLFDQQIAAVLQGLQIDADVLHALVQQPQLFIEDEQRGFFTPGHRRGGEHHGDQRFAGPGRTENQSAGTGFDTAAQQRIHFPDATGQLLAQVLTAMFGGHQTRKYMHAVAGDGEVMKAAPVFLAAVLHHAHAPSLGTVIGRQLFQANHAVGDAVHGLVQ
ncbi:hypothetical protein D3C85_1047090 [compost metagenome]